MPKKADAVQTDPRFARLHTDPRFQRLPKQQNKVKVDKRFSRLFTDKDFKVVKQSAPVDSKGRKSKAASDDAIQRRFEMDEDDEAAAPTSKKKRRKAEVSPVEQVEEEEEEEEDEEGDEPGEGEQDVDEEDGGFEEGEGSTTEDDSDDDEVEGEEDEEEEESALLSFIQQQASVPRVKDATSRLAVVNCDWEQMRAVDLLVMLRSFVPSGGSIRSVAVYLSDFGAEQQRLEAVRGPSGIWEEADDDEDDDARGGKRKGKGAKSGVIDGGKVDNEKLRKYELDRFKHYYGVVTCDSARTADAIYTECDGTELEASSMVLDLRFIPEDMSFAREPRDEATEVPAKYATPAFASSALQQSTVTSTWDADDNERKRAMQRDFKKSGIKEMDYSKYLASESDDDDDDGVEEYPFLDAPLAPPKSKSGVGASALRALGVGGGGGADEGDEGDDGMTHELTYLPALEEKTKQKAKRREMGLPDEPEAPSVFELEEQKRAKKAKQRKQERLAARNGGGAAAAAVAADEADDDDDDDDEMPADMADDPFFAEAMAERDEEDRQARGLKRPATAGRAAAASSSAADPARGGNVDRRKGKKGKKGRPVLTPEEAAAEAKRAAELELLLMDGDAEDVRGYDAKQLELPTGGKNLKGKRRAREEAAAAAATAAAAEDGFKLNSSDKRFEKLFKSSDYAIDPTHPKFKRTVATEQLMAEVSRRHEIAPAEPEPAPKGASSDPVLAKLVSSLKAKEKAKGKSKLAK